MSNADELIGMPIAEAIRRASENGDTNEVVRLVEAAPMETWFGIPLDELRGTLAAVPASDFDPERIGLAFRVLLNPETRTDRPTGGVGDGFIRMLSARLRGRPVSAASVMDESRAPAAVVQPLFDPEAGFTCALWVHRGITYMLAGRLAEARDCFATATVTPPPAALTMLLRDAYVKCALVHALFGSPRNARRDLDIADTLPMTTSWAEQGVAAHREIVEALLCDDHELEAALARLERVPAVLVGEIWPYWVLAVFLLHLRAGRATEGASRVEFLSVGMVGVSDGEGLPGSATALARALAALATGERELDDELLAGADPDLVVTRLLAAGIRARRGQMTRAIAELTELRDPVAGFDQLESLRIVLLVDALLRCGDEEAARAQVTGFAARSPIIPRAILAGYPEVADFATRHVPEWRSAAVDSSSRRTLTRRELEVLRLLAGNRTREEIAEELFVSVNTVKSQLTSIFRKLDVDNRFDAVRVGVREGLL